MTIAYNKLKVRVSLDDIKNNYTLLNKRGGRAIAVVKADAYGHGLVPVARTLEKSGADTFAVGTVDEAAQLRDSGCQGRIISLLGPMDASDYPALWDYGVTPFVGTFGQLDRLSEEAAGRDEPLEISLKFDTGMARLGFSEGQLPELISRLESLPAVRPALASSHLATADEPGQFAFMKEQAACFERILSALRKAGIDPKANLANSAAILAHDRVHHQCQRPGIALYGANPFHGTELEEQGAGLRQAMEVTAPVIQVHELKKGRSISYGRTFTAPGDMRVAIVGVGYADCYSRGLSGKGWMLLHGVRAPILGRVCMQLTAVDVSHVPQASAGDEVFLLGGPGADRISAEDLADWWGTITYEVFCLLGMNKRTYTGGAA